MFNKVILMGRITHDLEPKTTVGGEMYLQFSIAVDRPVGKNGEKEADFFNCTAFRKTAEFISAYFSKGRSILIEGQLRNDNYTNKDGVSVKSVKVIVDNARFTGEKKDQSNQQANYTTAQPQYAPQPPPQYAQPPLQPLPQYPQQQQPFPGQFVQAAPTTAQPADDYPF